MTAEVPAPRAVGAVWNVSHWNDGSVWQGVTYPPGAGWGSDWRFWYQVGTSVAMELTGLVVEARWTTDSHTQADGTYRGNVQPGKCAIRLWDPTGTLDDLDKYGAVWACHIPSGGCWAWFYNTLTRGLYAPGDRLAADCVFSGDSWPLRMTADTYTAYLTPRPIESLNSRLNNLVDTLISAVDFHLPTIGRAIAAQTQQIPAMATPVNAAGGTWPSWLGLVRDAAANGVAWWQYAGGDVGVAGVMTFRYDRWETNSQRPITGAQIVTGPPVDASAGFVYGFVDMMATRGADNYATGIRYGGNMSFAGAGNLSTVMYGDIENTPGVSGRIGPDWAATSTTVSQMAQDHSDPTERVLSTITCQSGDRHAPAGGPSSAVWDSHAHVWSPIEVMSYLDPVDNKTHLYRVTTSSHILNAATWQTVHSLEKYSTAAALP
jgi:hypothetical protein